MPKCTLRCTNPQSKRPTHRRLVQSTCRSAHVDQSSLAGVIRARSRPGCRYTRHASFGIAQLHSLFPSSLELLRVRRSLKPLPKTAVLCPFMWSPEKKTIVLSEDRSPHVAVPCHALSSGAPNMRLPFAPFLDLPFPRAQETRAIYVLILCTSGAAPWAHFFHP